MGKQDIVIRLQFFEAAVHDGTFAFVVRDPGTSLGLLACMMAHLHQGIDDIFKGIHIVVDEQQTLLILNKFLLQYFNIFLYFIPNLIPYLIRD